MNRLAALAGVGLLLVAAFGGQYGDTLLEHTTTRIDGRPTPGDPDQPLHAAGVGVGALPWITGW